MNKPEALDKLKRFAVLDYEVVVGEPTSEEAKEYEQLTEELLAALTRDALNAASELTGTWRKD